MRLNIEAERVRNQLTMEELSSKLGIASKTYSRYVKQDASIPSNVLLDMARLFHCSTDYLLGLEERK